VTGAATAGLDRHAQRRRAGAFVGAVVLLHLGVACFATHVHEMWRDELHCWLVARDSASPWEVVRARAYDGQPPLWYWMLWILTRFTWRPELMRVVHVAIVTSTVAVFAAKAPFGRWPRALFAFGYFVAYEYAAFARCYSLALLFALLLCVNHEARGRRPLVTGALLAAIALTTTVGTLIATAYAVALAIDAAASRSWREMRHALVPLCLAAAGVGAAAMCAWPPADSTVAHIGVAPQMPWEFAYTRVVAALLPLPPATFFFWNSNAVLDAIASPALRCALAAALFAVTATVVSRRRFSLILYVVATALLVALFKGVYSGSVRHHGFIFVAFVMSAWIASGGTPLPAAARGWQRFRAAALSPTLVAILVAHVPGAAIAIAYDARYIFSSGKRAADALLERGLGDAPLVAEFDYPATAVLGQLGPRSVAYSPRTGRPFTFVKWTRDRLWEPTDEETLRFAEDFGRRRGEDPVLIMNRPLVPPLVDGDRVVRLAELYDSMIEEENFYLYRVRPWAGATRPESGDRITVSPGRAR
jgi:hypothetical protein